ncbi:MAG: carboxymuconolactone decarboxylase family protein [Pseudomonadota bacterium]
MTEERRDTLWDKGLETRREVVGDDYVDRSLDTMDGFNDALQDFITRYAWGDVWNRPGLGRRDRSLLNVGMLIALGKPEELKLHLKGALRNGVTRDEIKEAILQSAIYCGGPAALEATRIARAAFAELASDPMSKED